MKLSLKNITTEDLNSIKEIEDKLFKYPWSLKLLEDALNYSNVPQIKALINNEIIGYLFWNTYKTGNFSKESEILNIAIDKNFQRKSYAQALLEHMELIIHNSVENIFLEVRKDNIPAQNLYKKIGFKEVGLRKRYYKDKVDAIIMKKKIY